MFLLKKIKSLINYFNKDNKNDKNKFKQENINIGDVMIFEECIDEFKNPFLNLDNFIKKYSSSIFIIDDIQPNEDNVLWTKYHYLEDEIEGTFNHFYYRELNKLSHTTNKYHEKLKNYFMVHSSEHWGY
jgi:hypothetical protein